MERIDLFDRYIFDELSSAEHEEFERRLESDDEFASEFGVYKLCVNSIHKEAEQDNLDFYHAMKSISQEQLRNSIERKPTPITREQLMEQLRGKLNGISRENNTMLSGMAALTGSGNNDDEIEIPQKDSDAFEESTGESPKKTSGADRFRLATLIFIVILLIALIMGLFM